MCRVKTAPAREGKGGWGAGRPGPGEASTNQSARHKGGAVALCSGYKLGQAAGGPHVWAQFGVHRGRQARGGEGHQTAMVMAAAAVQGGGAAAAPARLCSSHGVFFARLQPSKGAPPPSLASCALGALDEEVDDLRAAGRRGGGGRRWGQPLRSPLVFTPTCPRRGPHRQRPPHTQTHHAHISKDAATHNKTG